VRARASRTPLSAVRRAVRKQFGRDAPKPLTRMAAGQVRSGSSLPVRDRLGRVGRFGPPTRKSFPVFGLLARKLGLRWTENPRVVGSIPTLATTSNSMIRIGFRHRLRTIRAIDGRPRTIGKCVGGDIPPAPGGRIFENTASHTEHCLKPEWFVRGLLLA